MEQFANNVSTTLNTTINSSATSVVVVSATGFPSTGTFRILIDDELMLVTARSGTTLTVTRAAEGTTAAGHTAGAVIDLVITKGAFDQLRADLSPTFSYATIPTTISKTGRLAPSTDGYYMFWESNSLGWVKRGPLHKFTRPTDSGYSWTNQGSATVTTTAGHLVFFCPANGSDSVRLRGKSTPSTPYSLTMCATFTSSGSSVWFGGLYVSDGTKLVTYGVGVGGSNFGSIAVYKWNSTTSFNSFPVELNLVNYMHLTGRQVWLKFRDDGTNRIFSIGNDGQNWYPVFTETRTTFLTATSYGYCMNRNNSTDDAYMTIYSYEEGA